MATKEFNLSEKTYGTCNQLIDTKDVKEFIKRLKEKLPNKVIEKNELLTVTSIYGIIDKLVGSQLK